MLPEDVRGLLVKQHYGLVGGHSAVKPCMWLKRSLRGAGFCYKQKFYGIESHRCLQMTPAVAWCSMRCVFCWRNTEATQKSAMGACDDPEDIIDGCIHAHRQAISGFGGLPLVEPRLIQEARKPKHAAISLSGEPTIYPHLGGLIGGFTRRGMTTYLVTNGTFPGVLESLSPLPTQLYVSLTAPNPEIHGRVNLPIAAGTWERINETLVLLPSLSTRKVVRLTAVKGMNMVDPAGYARLIGAAEPDFVEVKAFMFVGGARARLSMDNMPSHDEVKDFAGQIAGELGYEVKDEKIDSRVVLLAR